MIRRIAVWFSLTLVTLCGLLTVWLQLRDSDFNVDDLSGVIFVLGIVVVGCLILLHKPENRLGWLFTAIGVLWAVSNTLQDGIDYFISSTGQVDAGLSWLALAGSWSSDLAWGTSATFIFLLFPDGRMPSPRWRWVAGFVGGVLLVSMTLNLMTPGPLSQVPAIDNPLGMAGLVRVIDFWNQLEVLFILMIMVCLVSVFIRFLTADTQVRRQIKWVAYLGIVLAGLYLMQGIASWVWVDSLTSRILDAIGALAFGGFPLVIGIAVLRYRLFDIDLIIRKTLVYSILTGLFTLVYLDGVALLQSLLSAFGGQSSAVVIVVTTLAIAALFNPLRHRVQDFIDRRFYRQKYNAEQALADFATAARSETNLAQLSNRLIVTAYSTLQPEYIGLWLKPYQKPLELDSSELSKP